MMTTLYWCPKTRAARVLWLLEEIGAPYDLAPIDIHESGAKAAAEFRAASPMGKVPALVDGAVKMWDSASICLYLADRHAGAGLAPPLTDPRRAAYCFWMLFTPGMLEPATFEKLSGAEPSPGTRGWGDFPSMLDVLRGSIEPGPWLLGDTFSAADVMVGSSLHFLRTIDVLEADAAIDRYVARCLERPAYQRTLAIEHEAGGE